MQNGLVRKCSWIPVTFMVMCCIPQWLAASTSSVTPTPVPENRKSDFWYEGFIGTAGQQPESWLDESDDAAFNAHILTDASGTAANIVRTGEDVWGKVLSPVIRCDLAVYPMIEVEVLQVSPMTSWKINLLIAGTDICWDLSASQTEAGVFFFNAAAVTGLSGDLRFVLQLIVEGAAGSTVVVDTLRVTGMRREDGAFVSRDVAEPEQVVWQDVVVKIKGANYYPTQHGWERMWLEWDPDAMHAELSRAPQLGINLLRAFIHYDAFGGAAVDRRMLARMEEFLYIADRHGLKVAFTFFPMYRDYSMAARADMKAHVRTIAERFRGDSRIFGWGVTNELDVHAAMFFGELAAMPDAVEWHNDMAAYLQSVDPNHLVISATAWPETMAWLDMTHIDVYALHYHGPLDAYQGNIMRARTLMEEHGCVKPVLLEEFGMDFSQGYGESETREYFSNVYTAVSVTDICGSIVWLLNDTEDDGALHAWGIFTEAGILRPGAAVIGTDYTGSGWSAAAPVGRNPNPERVKPPVQGQETVLLNSQLSMVADKWAPVDNRAEQSVEAEGVRIHHIVRGAEVFGYGQIERLYAVGVDMERENDLHINIRELTGRWYAFLSNTPTGYTVRLQYDTPVKGEYIYNLDHYLPENLRSGYQYFTLAVGGVESPYCMDAASVLVENVSLATGDRPAPLPLPVDTVWMDDFQGTMWIQPPGWTDESDDDALNGHLAYSAEASLAAITRTADGLAGQVTSPLLACNIDQYPCLELNVAKVLDGASWRVRIQEQEGAKRQWELGESQTSAGIFRYDIPECTGLKGEQRIVCQIVVEGNVGGALVLDRMRVCLASHTPTMTPTPTVSEQDTIAMTMTPEASWLPSGTVLAYPNPARGRVYFAYTVAGPGSVKIDIYTLAGERVASITEQIQGSAGQTLSTVWEAANVSAGIYFCRIVMTDTDGTVILQQKKKVAVIR